MFHDFCSYLVFSLFGFSKEDRIAAVIEFFIYDSVRILFMVFIVVAFIGLVRTFVKPTALKEQLSKLPFGVGHFIASAFGAITPFCSCSSIPIFIGFLNAQVPLGIAFAFLVTSPLVNEVAFVIMGTYFGWEVSFLYAGSGILLGMVAGMILGCFSFQKHVILGHDTSRFPEHRYFEKFAHRLTFAFSHGLWTLKKLYPYILGGVFIGALIHGYVPREFFIETIGKYQLLSVPIAVLVGIPVYAGCSTIVPVIFSITASGVPLGTSLAFMMSIAGLSLPEAIILKRVMSLKLLAAFFGVVAAGIIIIGYLFNYLVP